MSELDELRDRVDDLELLVWAGDPSRMQGPQLVNYKSSGELALYLPEGRWIKLRKDADGMPVMTDECRDALRKARGA